MNFSHRSEKEGTDRAKDKGIYDVFSKSIKEKWDGNRQPSHSGEPARVTKREQVDIVELFNAGALPSELPVTTVTG